MSETPNYGLYLEDDASTRFQEWREKINGTENSNMVKIDTALGTMAQKSGKVVGTLLASAWSGIDSPFTQTLAVEGLGADQNGNISVAQNATIEQRDAARMAMLSVIGQSEGQLIISASRSRTRASGCAPLSTNVPHSPAHSQTPRFTLLSPAASSPVSINP